MKLPSVTTVLSPFSDFSMIRPDVLQRAAERGTRVHAACAAFTSGQFAWGLEQGDWPFFDSFSIWATEVDPLFLSIEQEFVDEKLGYMGHPDTIIRYPGDKGLTVIDYKTPLSVSKTWLPQIAAYAHLARNYGYDVKRGLALRLKKHGGRPIVTEVDIDGEPWAAFLNALGAYRYFQRR